MNKKEIASLIKRRRRQLIVHSYGYYRLNENIISDHTFDQWSKELVELQEKYPAISKKVELYKYFKDFDGSTGMDLPMDLDWVAPLWERLKAYEKTKSQETKSSLGKKTNDSSGSK